MNKGLMGFLTYAVGFILLIYGAFTWNILLIAIGLILFYLGGALAGKRFNKWASR